MVYSVLGDDLVVTFGPEEIAELFPSGDSFTELKVNGIWHDDCFLLNHFGQAQQIPGGNGTTIFAFARAMTQEPSDDGPGVFLVLDVEVEERRGYSFST